MLFNTFKSTYIKSISWILRNLEKYPRDIKVIMDVKKLILKFIFDSPCTFRIKLDGPKRSFKKILNTIINKDHW